VVQIVKNRKELTDEMVDVLEECVMDSAKAKAIVDASKSSMGNFLLLIFFLLDVLIVFMELNKKEWIYRQLI